jgi:hypothetical protein
MRLRGIKTKESANEFLREYLPKFNQRFKVCPANDTDVHVKLPKHFNLDKYLCIKTERTVRNDNTITHNRRLYQIVDKSFTTATPSFVPRREDDVKSKKVTVEERLNGSMDIMSKGVSLKYREIAEKPVKTEDTIVRERFHRPVKPGKNHPWRRRLNWNIVAKKEDACILTK